jgi:ubiquinone/menaquinone biosynthesis C-methylase UbiE
MMIEVIKVEVTVDRKGFWDNQWLRESPEHSNNTTYAYKLVQKSDFSGKRVLEVGCGAIKHHRRWHLSESGIFVGLDISEQALIGATRRSLSNQSFVVGDAKALPFKNDSFDTVVAFETLSFNGTEFFSTLKEIARVSRSVVIFNVMHSDCFGGKFHKERLRCGTLVRYEGAEGRIDEMGFTKKEIESLLDELNLKERRIILASRDEYATYGSELYHVCRTDGGETKKDIYVEATKRRQYK